MKLHQIGQDRLAVPQHEGFEKPLHSRTISVRLLEHPFEDRFGLGILRLIHGGHRIAVGRDVFLRDVGSPKERVKGSQVLRLRVPATRRYVRNGRCNHIGSWLLN